MVGWHHRHSGHGSEKLREMVEDREASCAAVHGVTEWEVTATEEQAVSSISWCKDNKKKKKIFKEFSL